MKPPGRDGSRHVLRVVGACDGENLDLDALWRDLGVEGGGRGARDGRDGLAARRCAPGAASGRAIAASPAH